MNIDEDIYIWIRWVELLIEVIDNEGDIFPVAFSAIEEYQLSNMAKLR